MNKPNGNSSDNGHSLKRRINVIPFEYNTIKTNDSPFGNVVYSVPMIKPDLMKIHNDPIKSVRISITSDGQIKTDNTLIGEKRVRMKEPEPIIKKSKDIAGNVSIKSTPVNNQLEQIDAIMRYPNNIIANALRGKFNDDFCSYKTQQMNTNEIVDNDKMESDSDSDSEIYSKSSVEPKYFNIFNNILPTKIEHKNKPKMKSDEEIYINKISNLRQHLIDSYNKQKAKEKYVNILHKEYPKYRKLCYEDPANIEQYTENYFNEDRKYFINLVLDWCKNDEEKHACIKFYNDLYDDLRNNMR